MVKRAFIGCGVALAAVLTLMATPERVDAFGFGDVHGRGRFEKIKGQPQMGYVELYESDLFMSFSDSSILGQARRLGTTWWGGTSCITSTVGDGRYCIHAFEGDYSLLVNQPDFFIRPKVVPDLTVVRQQVMEVNVELPIDYSTYFNNSWTNPGTTWYQTFTATGTGVTGVSFLLAGTSAGQADVSILEDNGDPDVRNWQHVATRRESSIGANTDNWVRWRSGEVPMIPQTRYAVRVTGIGGTFQPYKRDKDSNSYGAGDPDIEGQAYDQNGIAQNFDLNYVVFADNDGTIVTMNKRNSGIGFLQDGNFGTRWGQTFVAQGQGLAGVDVFAAGAENQWDLDFLWKVREGGPTGTQIGPDKITEAAFFGAGAGLHGVSYNPDEVTLVPGQTYFVEFNIHNPPAQSPGFNPYIMTGDDSYADGIAYQDNTPRSTIDLNMTIVEYAVAQPIIALDKSAIDRAKLLGSTLTNDSFTVTNAGSDGTVLDYDVTDDATWLSVSPTQGSSTGESDTITISYDGPAIPYGLNTATITVSGDALNSPQTIDVTVEVGTIGPDLDGDWDVDQVDYGLFQECYSGDGVPVTAACVETKLDEDDDCDQEDFLIFQGCVTGPGGMADPACVGS